MKMLKQKSKRTNFKNLSVSQLQHPLRYLAMKKKEYSPEYLRQLPYRIKKRYLNNMKHEERKNTTAKTGG